MKPVFHRVLMALILLGLGHTATSHAEKRKTLSPAQQESFLSSETSGILMGTFNSYCSTLFAASDVAIHTESGAINQTRLNSPFPDFYQPTWGELFDTIARQTKSSWKYDPKRDFWVFAGRPKPLPFAITLAKGWKSHDQGLYISYKPPTAPVGMDVYVLGRYSATNQADEAALQERVREAIAVRFAAAFKQSVAVQDMKEVLVGQLPALHFQATARTGIIWRQWIIVDSGMAFAIVSAVKPEQEWAIVPDVFKMVTSFKVSVPKSEAGSRR